MSPARRVDLTFVWAGFLAWAALGLLALPVSAAAAASSEPALLVSVSPSAGKDGQERSARIVCVFFAEQRRGDGSVTDCFPVTLSGMDLAKPPTGVAPGGHRVVLPRGWPMRAGAPGVPAGLLSAARVPSKLTGTRTTATTPTEVAIEASIDVVPEGVGSVSLEVRRFCPAASCDTGAASVQFATEAGSATGSDFIDQSGTLEWDAGELFTKVVEIDIVDDTEHEPDIESFSVVLSGPMGTNLSPGGGRSVIEIEDDDPASPPPTTATEFFLDVSTDVVPENVGAITVMVRRECTGQPCSPAPASVDYATEGGSATAGEDFGQVGGKLSWAASDLAPRSFVVPIVDDEQHEADVESFRVLLRNPKPSGDAGIKPGGGELFVEIADDDPSAGGIRFVTPALAVGEADGVASLGIARAGGSAGMASVTVDVRSGSAEAGDFGPASPATLVWADGEAGEKSVSVAVFPDDEDFENDTVILTLANAVGAGLLLPSSATLTILDDDADAGRFEFAKERRRVREDDGDVEIIVRRRDGTSGMVSVEIQVVEDGATRGEDFEELGPNPLIWADGETRKTFQLRIKPDNSKERDEELILRLVDPNEPRARLGEFNELRVTILENDKPVGMVAHETETEITAEVGERVELEVRLTDAQEEPVKAASVLWRLTPEGSPEGSGVGQLLEGCEEGQRAELTEAVRTDENGVAAACVGLLRTGELVVEASSENVVPPVVFRISSRLFKDPKENEDDPFDEDERPVAVVLEEVCLVTEISPELRSVCNALVELKLKDPLAVGMALDALSIDDHGSQADASRNAGASQSSNLLARMASIKSGAAGLGIEQLALDIRGERLPGTVLAGLLRPADDRGPDSRILARVLPHLGPWAWEDGEVGGDSLSPRDLRSLLAPHGAHPEFDFDLEALLAKESPPGTPGVQESDPVADEQFVRKLRFFVNGTIALGDRPSTDTDTGFDFETAGLSLGAYYRFSDSLFVGGALGYVSSDSELDNGSRLDTEGVSVGAFALYLPTDHLAIDGLAIYGRNRLEMDRFVDFPGRPGRVRGNPDGDQISLGLGAAYDGNLGAWYLSGFGRLSYLEATVDPYAERGAPTTTGYELRIGKQELTSLVSRIGLDLSYAASNRKPALLPGLSVSYLHEFEDASRVLTASFVGDLRASPATFSIPTEEPDRDYFSAAVSLQALFSCDRQLWFALEQDLQRADLKLYMLRAGFKFTFGGCKKATITPLARSATGSGGTTTGE